LLKSTRFYCLAALVFGLAAAAAAQTLTISVRDASSLATAYLDTGGTAIVARCMVGPSVREMVLPRTETPMLVSVGEGTDIFTTTLSKRDAQGAPLPAGVYRIQAAAAGQVCLDFYRCDANTCTKE